ncbi:hypothetical protein ACHAXA_000417, partial [Cyclostephanos tholiformis]
YCRREEERDLTCLGREMAKAKSPLPSFPWLPLLAVAVATTGGGMGEGCVASCAFLALRRHPSSTIVGSGIGRALTESSNFMDGDDGGGGGGGGGGDGGLGRREFLLSRAVPSAAASAAAVVLLLPPSSPPFPDVVANAASVPVQRAVGYAEYKCKSEGNCLEKLDFDAAVGWNWGGVDRCDASDPTCGPDGTTTSSGGVGTSLSPPPLPDGIVVTDVVEMTLTIGSGSRSETRTLRMGLYGEECPESAREMIDLCGRSGLVTSRDLLLGSPVRLAGGGGSLTYIRGGERLDFGVPSQRVAYARYTRRAKAPDEFVPQSRPDGERLRLVREERSARAHDVAGLVSIPREGIGYGGGLVLGKDDEAYASSFQLTVGAVPGMDGEGRKVIGQLLDDESMDTLSRLAGLATRKLIPGQSGGTPLIKVNVDDSVVYSMQELTARESKT